MARIPLYCESVLLLISNNLPATEAEEEMVAGVESKNIFKWLIDLFSIYFLYNRVDFIQA